MSRLSPRGWSLIAAAVAATFPAHAEDFSWQLSGSTHRTETGDFHTDAGAVDATYYMNPVDDSAGPYALSSFLNPTTRVSATASTSNTHYLVDDPTAYTLSGAYVLPGERWYVGASYARSQLDDAWSLRWSDPKGYGVLAGRYLGANTTLELGLSRSEEGYETSQTCVPWIEGCVAGPVVLDETSESLSLELFHVRRFRSLTYSLQGSVSESETEEDFRSPMSSWVGRDSMRVYSVAGELFPTNRLGVRLGYSTPDFERFDLDIDNYDVAATWFFKPRIAVEFSLSRTTRGDAPESDDSKGAAIRLIGRL